MPSSEALGLSQIQSRQWAIFKTSAVKGTGLFEGLPRPLPVMRYHSLVLDGSRIPQSLERTAWTTDGLVMARRHRSRPLWGVQFHPESIGTPDGPGLLANFLRRRPLEQP